jgi:hypothetical protein
MKTLLMCCTRARKFLGFLAIAVLFFMATVIGCKTAPMTNTVVCRADSPSGGSSALLVERYVHAALSSNQFYLLVLSKNQDKDKAVNDRDIGDSSPLVATLAGKVKLRWQSDNTLLVICDSCGLEAVDISKKLDQIGSVNINYQGFPEHTAYK